jgi:iron complex outermembrane receptor protein
MLSLLLMAGSISASWADSGHGEQDSSVSLKHLSLEQLGNTEVTTVSKEPVKVARTPAAIYVITQEDIRRSGATSIPEALRLAPGVEVARIDSVRWSVGVRGFGSRLSRAVLVLIDGRSVYTPLFAGVYWEVQDTLLEDVDRIEVIRGPGGTIWGANAVNGVINIITRRTSDTHGTLVSVAGGNVNQGSVGFRYGAGNDKNLNYRLYGKGFNRGHEFLSGQRQFDDWRMGQAGFRTDWDLRNRETLTLQGDLYNGDAGEKVGITTYSPPATINVERNAVLSGGNLLGRWRRVLDEGSDVELQGYYDRTDRHEPTYGEIRDTFDIDFLHHLTLPRRQNFLWGVGARLSPAHFIQVVPTVTFAAHSTDQLYSAFVQDEIAIVGDQLWLTIGSKFLHNNYTGFEVQPSARLLWAPTARQTFWTAVTRAVRTPSGIEEDFQATGLISANPLLFVRAIGDGKFSSERLISYEAGYRSLVVSKLYLDVATFYNDYSHLLSAVIGAPFSETTPPPAHLVIPFFLRNGLLGNTYGIELAPDWRPTSWWRLAGSYSYLHMNLSKERSSLDSSTVKSTEGSSPHQEFMIQSFVDLPKNLEFNLSGRYVSALPAQQVRSYWTADIEVGWHPTHHILFSVAGQNLWQPHHPEFAGDPEALVEIKRSVYANITWRSTAD